MRRRPDLGSLADRMLSPARLPAISLRTPDTPPPSRLGVVNGVRALVCLSIMTRHFATSPVVSGLWPEGFSLTLWLPGTECFLVLSGFFLAHMFRLGGQGYLSVRDFARRRMYRLLVSYWVVLAVAYVSLPAWRLATTGAVPGDVFTPEAILSNFLCVADVFGHPSPMLFLWTVATLIQGYALWSAVFWTARWRFLRERDSDYHERAVSVLMNMSTLVAIVLGSLSWCDQLPNLVWQLPRFCPFAAAGAMSYWVGVRQMKPWRLILVLAVMVAGGCVATSPRPLFAASVVGLLVAASLWRGAAVGWRRLDVLSFVGERSYSIYLVHGFVGVRLWAGLEFAGWRPETDLEAILFVLLAIAASIGVGHLLFRFVEKPLADRAAKVEYRR